MIGIVKTKPYFWNNRYADHPVLSAILDLSGSHDQGVVHLDDVLVAELKSALPIAHDADWLRSLGHFVAHVALALQRGHDCVLPVCGVAPSADQSKERIFFAARDPHFADVALRTAVALVWDLISGTLATPPAVRDALKQIHLACSHQAPDPLTCTIARTLVARGIPFFRLNGDLYDLKCGLGSKRRSIVASLTSRIPSMAVRQTHHKPTMLHLLETMRLPIGRFRIAGQPHEAVRIADEIGFPVRLRPVVDGASAVVTLPDGAAVRAAAQRMSGPALLQHAFKGSDHRLLVVDGRVVAGIRLAQASGIGDGGVAAHDITDEVHPDNAQTAVRAALALGLPVADIDFVTPDIAQPWTQAGGRIEDVRVGDGLAPYLAAIPDRDIAGPIVDTLFPDGDNGRIPTAMVTGTIGKTTTCNMLAAILRTAGFVVGKATTSGVEIDGRPAYVGDSAAVDGADVVLGDPRVNAAVLETARGGLRKFGSALDWCDAAALLNVDTEHVGRDGIETVEAMAAHKRKVTDCARKAVILNADCPHSSALIDAYPAERVIAFSLDPVTAGIRDNLGRGGRAIVVGDDGAALVLVEQSGSRPICAVMDMPSSLRGLARHNIANAMAAAGLALGLGVAIETIGEGLRAFRTTPEQSPSRLNIIEGYPFQVIFDWACNPQGYDGIMPALAGLPVEGRRLCALMGIGKRPDADYERMARAAAGRFDLYVPYDGRMSLPGRERGEVADLLRHGLLAAGVAEDAVRQAGDLRDGLTVLHEVVRPGDLLVILGSRIDRGLPLFEEIFGTPDP